MTNKNAQTHGLTATVDGQEVLIWVDMITSNGTLAPKDCHEALALAEAEIRFRAARAHWRQRVAEVASPFEETEMGRAYEEKRRVIEAATLLLGLEVLKESQALLREFGRMYGKTSDAREKNFRLAARYYAESASARRRCLDDWIAY